MNNENIVSCFYLCNWTLFMCFFTHYFVIKNGDNHVTWIFLPAKAPWVILLLKNTARNPCNNATFLWPLYEGVYTRDSIFRSRIKLLSSCSYIYAFVHANNALSRNHNHMERQRSRPARATFISISNLLIISQIYIDIHL